MFQDRHAVITGASSGIGAALARELHRRGARVTLVARRRALLETLAGELGDRCRVIVRDVAEAPVGGWLAALDEPGGFGAIDIFVNNAGVQDAGPFAVADAARTQQLLDVDLLAPLALARAVVPRMLAQGRGVLVNVSSVAALAPPSGMVVYAAAKAGLAGFSEALAAELAGSGVHVLTVYPGPIDNGSPQDTYDLYGRDSLAAKLPVGKDSDLARAVCEAISRRRKRLIWPRFYALVWWWNPLARWLVARGTPKLPPR